MLAGRNDVAFVSGYVARMATFSDDGQTFHGAYGYRWRQHFGFDQLNAVVKALKANPDDRRCVVQMWSAQDDLGREGK
ncbi:thymidylate synthase, partial [Staphylococcus aureus]